MTASKCYSKYLNTNLSNSASVMQMYEKKLN